jgi:DNA-binding NarL/FixJ family response regulator
LRLGGVGILKIRAAIVEDDPAATERLTLAIAATSDIEVVATAHNAEAGLEMIKRGGFDVLLCDLGLPDGNGIELIRETAKRHPKVDIIVVTIFANQVKVIDSIKAGARGYLLKDDHLENCAENIREIRQGGSPISPMIARQLLRRLVPDRSEIDKPLKEALSTREAEVLNLLARGFSYAEIAGVLSIGQHTVGTYVKRVYRKLEVNSRSEAVFEASSRGIIDVH